MRVVDYLDRRMRGDSDDSDAVWPMGAQRGNPASLCVAARREIAAKTGAGSQLVYRP